MIPDEEVRRARLLIVDDQQANLDTLVEILSTAGYLAVTCVSDSREAVARYADLRPDLVLLDINMPHLDGFAVLAGLRAVDPGDEPVVLVLTGQADLATRVRALASGARDFIAKPFEVPEVLARIRNMLETRLLGRRVLDQNHALAARVAERTRELREAQFEVVHRLARAAERRDHSTGAHIERMSRYCARVAAAHGWFAEDVELMLQASPMHDIGKIAIPDAILLKAGPLAPEEWKIMRTHAAIGAELLSGGTSRLIQTCRTIARSHHEKWDGTGYPDGLAGEAIPLSARICAVCDVFDAITSDRCYHQAVDVDEAVKMVRMGSGAHFDPAVVASFERALPELLAIRAAAPPEPASGQAE